LPDDATELSTYQVAAQAEPVNTKKATTAVKLLVNRPVP
jgi:hypothetical protein